MKKENGDETAIETKKANENQDKCTKKNKGKNLNSFASYVAT